MASLQESKFQVKVCHMSFLPQFKSVVSRCLHFFFCHKNTNDPTAQTPFVPFYCNCLMQRFKFPLISVTEFRRIKFMVPCIINIYSIFMLNVFYAECILCWMYFMLNVFCTECILYWMYFILNVFLLNVFYIECILHFRFFIPCIFYALQ